MAQTIYCQKVIEKNTTHLVFKGLNLVTSQRPEGTFIKIIEAICTRINYTNEFY